MLPKSVENLMAELGRLPGVGRRSAERMAFDLLARSPARPLALARALENMVAQVAACPCCFYFAEGGVCPLCTDPRRDAAILCVVETSLDVAAFDRVAGVRPRFHVLGGRLSPLRDIAPADLHIGELLSRVRSGVGEVILATSPTGEGEATAVFLAGELAPLGVRTTRIGRGVPMGGSLEHSDVETLRLSLEMRRPFSP